MYKWNPAEYQASSPNQKKGFEGCWECDEFEACNKLREKHLNNLKRIKKVGTDGFLKARK